MMWLGYGSGWMGIWMVLFWGGVIALIAWSIRASSTPRRDRTGSARAILEERFARGEIDRPEFEERARALEES